ncbi:unnamed protein product, partial [Gulo gulo]
ESRGSPNGPSEAAVRSPNGRTDGQAPESRANGRLQHQEPGPAGPEEAPEQDGIQGHGGRVHRRHEQRGAGRAVPRHQGVHPQPQGGPEGAQEPGQGGGEAGRPAARRPAG